MANPNVLPTRVPSMNFRGNKFVNEDGTLTDVAQGFFDLLNAYLVTNVGDEGLVVPSQASTDIVNIQNAKNKSDTGIESYKCQFGTFIYDLTTNKMKVALNAGAGIPIFKEILTA